jgi:hypothetical protein
VIGDLNGSTKCFLMQGLESVTGKQKVCEYFSFRRFKNAKVGLVISIRYCMCKIWYKIIFHIANKKFGRKIIFHIANKKSGRKNFY